MEKADPRRKILFYLNPESNAAERYVCEETDRLPQGERGKVWRAALLAGFALRKQDPRLPNMLAEFLTEHTTFDEMVTLMQAVFPAEMKRLENHRPEERTGASRREQPAPAAPEDETRENARGMFGITKKGTD
ncbi:plasmid partitioning/stability family protein [Kosakonia cowanii]